MHEFDLNGGKGKLGIGDHSPKVQAVYKSFCSDRGLILI